MSTSTKRGRLVPKRELTLKGLGQGARQRSIDKLLSSTSRLSPIAPSPISPTGSSSSNSNSSSPYEDNWAHSPHTPTTVNRLEVPRTPHYEGVTPRYTGAFGTSPGTRMTPRTPRTPRTASTTGRYPPRTPRTPSAAAWEREHGFLPTLPERCQSVPLAEDWMPEPKPVSDGDESADADSSQGDDEDCGSVDGFQYEDEESVEAYDNDYEYEECDRDSAYEWGVDQPALTREEYALMLEKMREEAELSVCDGMMEQLELRDAFESAVEEMMRVKPEPERIRGLQRRRTIW